MDAFAFTSKPFRRRMQHGVALVVVLSIIVLVTVLVLSFLSISTFELESSTSYSRSLIADKIARGAVEEAVSSLRSEARQAILSSTDTNRFGLLPIRYGVVEADPRKSLLVRRSAEFTDGAFGDIFRSGGVANPPENVGSPLSSLEAALDGRKLSADRWRAPQFLSASESLTPPNWIYVTRKGAKKVSDADATSLRNLRDLTNLDAAVGRYAYAVYDTSGIFDLNVAGTPDLGPRAGEKGATAVADLLPVFNAFQGNATGLTSFLNWRNSDHANYLAQVYGIDPSPGSPGNGGALENGFREVSSGNNHFLSRSELLKYAVDHPEIFPSGALRYFSTFSRAALRPEIEAAIPGRPAFIENTADRNIIYYNLNGELKNYAVRKGEPFLQRKFPLARLRWFERKNAEGKPTDDIAPAIKQHFGLTWVDSFSGISLTAPEFAGKGGYVYTSPSGGTPTASIKTLAQVASEGREPDFFEWLKAAIKSGSLGISGGNSNTVNTAAQDSSQDFHLIQIGANIIDQADSDDIPTLIASACAVNRNGQPLVAFGVESLPYINEVVVSWHRPNSNVSKFNGYLEFEMWNPHQNATRTPRDYSGSEIAGDRFRVRVVEGRPWVYPRLRIMNSSNSVFSTVETQAAAMRSIVPKTFSGDPVDDSVIFSYGEADFSEPRLLGDKAAGSSTVVLDNRSVRFGVPPGESGYKGIFAGGSTASEPIFPAGARIPATGVASVVEDPAVPGYSYPIGEKYYNAAAMVFTNAGVVNPPAAQPQPITIVAEVQLSNGTWAPYQTIESWNNAGTSREYPGGKEPRNNGPTGTTPKLSWEPSAWQGVSSSDWKQWNWSNPGQNGPQSPYSGILTGNVTGRAYRGWEDFNYHNSLLKADPRTRRFGVPLAVRRASPGLSIRDGGSSADSVTDGFPDATLQNWTGTGDLSALGANLSSSALKYSDRDGVIRQGDWANLPISEIPVMPSRTSPRPVVLNRPFRSVADLGYAFRDLPWKTLNFFSADSADLGLLNVFSVEGGDVAAGKINLNTAQVEVVEAILAGATNNSAGFDGGTSGVVTDARVVAQSLIAAISANDAAAIRNSSEAVGRLIENGNYQSVNNKIHREAYARGLSGSTDSRTWNLMIDIIAQAGRLVPNAVKLSQFKVTGERRYWAHVAIDRVTGDLVDIQLEPVYE